MRTKKSEEADSRLPHLGVGQAEDAGVVGAPHHDLVLLARAMAAALGSRSLGTVALPGHPLAGGVSHGCGSSRGQPAARNDTGRGTPRGRVRGVPAPPLRPGRESPPQEAAPGVPRPCPLRGRLSWGTRSGSPLRPAAPAPHTLAPLTSGDALRDPGATRTPAVRRTERPIKLLKLKPRPKPATRVSS